MFRSLRARIQFWYGLLLGLVILSFATVLYIQQRRIRFAEVDDGLVASQRLLVGRLRATPPAVISAMVDEERGVPFADEQPRRAAARAADELLRNLQVPRSFRRPPRVEPHELPYFSLWRRDGRLITRSSPQAPERLPVGDMRAVPPPPRGGIRRGDVSLLRHGDRHEAIGPGPQGTVLLVGRRIDRERSDLRALFWLLVGTGGGVFIFGMLGGWLVAGRAIEPIRHMTAAANEISGSNWSRRLSASDTDTELGQLAHTLNEAFDRLELAYKQQAQFTADASHELRTPLSILQTHQQLALSRPRTADEYRQTLETCRRATERMSALVQSLLTLARLDAPSEAKTRRTANVCELVQRCLAIAQPLAATKQIQFRKELADAWAWVDPLQIEQVVTNLLSNAIHYSGPATEITVTCGCEAGKVQVAVSDRGIGIAEADLPRIFDRFYRVDQARSRDTGGSGLGLAISRQIVIDHGGTLVTESRLHEGSTFRMQLPAASPLEPAKEASPNP